jgi:hypothetical protein
MSSFCPGISITPQQLGRQTTPHLIVVDSKRNQDEFGPRDVDLGQQEVFVPLVRAQHSHLEVLLLKDLFDFDVVAFARLAERPGLFDDALGKGEAVWRGR